MLGRIGREMEGGAEVQMTEEEVEVVLTGLAYAALIGQVDAGNERGVLAFAAALASEVAEKVVNDEPPVLPLFS